MTTFRRRESRCPPSSDLPDEVALRFAEKDGTRGRIMMVQESDEFSTWDGRYLVRWADGAPHTPHVRWVSTSSCWYGRRFSLT